ncbi:Zinc finger BED domain-containing protein RICESLEEPER 2 [Nymphaea thermarum]|nr:Zinc finger BED domain-containing protein RICESLEEPER 2 [Nymphaea thermarum]
MKCCLLKWNIDNKLFSIIFDNCSINNNIVMKLRKWLLLKMHLFIHILDLVVQDGVQKISDLYLDISTRWNSTILKLNVALKYKDAISIVIINLAPSKDEWKKATIIHSSLKIFHNGTNVISVVNNSTSNIFSIEFCKIKMKIDRVCSSSNVCHSSVVKKMKEKSSTSLGYVSSTSYIVNIDKDNDVFNFTLFVEFSSRKKPTTGAVDDFLKKISQGQYTKSVLEEPIYSKNNPIDILT